MEVSKTRTLKVNMGNWEHTEEFFRCTVGTDDLIASGVDLEGTTLDMIYKLLSDFINDKLDAEVEAFIKKCSSITACEDSFALAWPPSTVQDQPAKAQTTAKKTLRRPVS